MVTLLGKQFQAPDETSGTDAILIGAEIVMQLQKVILQVIIMDTLEFRTGDMKVLLVNYELTSTGRLGIGTTLSETDQILMLNDQTVAMFCWNWWSRC